MLGIGGIEDLFLQRITERLPYLATVESYKSQINWAALAEGKEAPLVAVRTPAVLLALAGQKDEGGTYDDQDISHTFSLAVICKNLRGQEAARRDPAGAYQILDDLWLNLARQVLHEDLQPVQFLTADLAWSSDEMVIYVAQYMVKATCDYEST